MNKIDQACSDIIKGFKGYEDFGFEGQEKVASQKIKQRVSNKYQKALSSVNLRKVAQELREAAAPVVVTNQDMNDFIKELRNGQ